MPPVGGVVVLVPGVQVVVVVHIAAATNHPKDRRQNAPTLFRGIALFCLHPLSLSLNMAKWSHYAQLQDYVNAQWRACKIM